MKKNYSFLLKKTAAITPGTQPTQVKSVVINTAPQPRSTTASGGKIIHNNARPHPIYIVPLEIYFT